MWAERATGSPCTDEGEELPLHGSIANIPCEQAYWTEEDGDLVIHTVTKDEVIFGRKLRLSRKLRVSTEENCFVIEDTVVNTGDRTEPFEILYHMNMGYPLLDEDSVITIPSVEVVPRDDHAAEDIENWMHMEKPTAGYQERCYYHKFADSAGRGLECGNCYPDGRDVMRRTGMLKFLQPGEKKIYAVKVSII